MKIYPRSLNIKIYLIIFLVLVFFGCATNISQPKAEIQTPAPAEKVAQKTFDTPQISLDADKEELSLKKEGPPGDLPKKPYPPNKPVAEETPVPQAISEPPQDISPHNGPVIQKKSEQELLDSALAFCQASNDFWEQGDLENAIDALDQAYSLILKVNPKDNPELLQQREDLRFTISKRIIEVYSSRFTVANGYHKAIPLAMNSHVQKALNMFKGVKKDFFVNAYRRSGKYRQKIIKEMKKAGLPVELSWLPLIESGFKVRAFSRARALGLWQFIASTGYKYGLKRDQWIDERMDPEKSTIAAIAYLKELHQIFGDWATVLAAYNCGEGTVLKCIRTQKINYLDNFWDLYKKLPSETAFYVPKYMAVLHILNDPKTYGFNLPPVDKGIETEVVTIDKQVHLKTMAKYLGLSFNVLKGLNPELRRYSTPDKPYAFKIPIGKGAILLAKLNEIPVWRPPIPSYVTHKVRKGESLSVIARRYRTSVRSIMALNRLKNSRYIKTGWRLKIPSRKRYSSLKKASLPVYRSKEKKKIIKYNVRKGDSLWKIAKRHRTTTKAIQSLNNFAHGSLQIGQTLLIPTYLAAFKKIKTKGYTVSKGDSPYFIAQKHQINLSKFLKLNNLTPRSTIFPGQVLLVRAE